MSDQPRAKLHGNRVTMPRTYRASPALAAAIARAAKQVGLSEASWVRNILAGTIGSALDEVPKPVRAYRAPRPKPTVETAAIAALREVVGEAAGTLRQVAGIDRARGGARLQEIDTAISQLIEAAEFLDKSKARLVRFDS